MATIIDAIGGYSIPQGLDVLQARRVALVTDGRVDASYPWLLLLAFAATGEGFGNHSNVKKHRK